MYVRSSSHLLPSGPYNVLTLFLVGMYAVRRRVFQDPRRNRRLLWTVLIVGAWLGIIGQILPSVWTYPAVQRDNLRPFLQAVTYRGFLWAVLGLGENMWLGLAYAAGFILLVGRFDLARRAAKLLSYAGRMSLTNYVMQVVMLELLFAWGTSPPKWPAMTRHGALALWSLHIPITRPTALLATFAFFGLQVLFSYWWTRRFRYGPLEWLWRSMTYARWQPIRRAPIAAPATP